jgi:hypothetical protein
MHPSYVAMARRFVLAYLLMQWALSQQAYGLSTFTCRCYYDTTIAPATLVVTAICSTTQGSVPTLECHCRDAGTAFAVTTACPQDSPSTVELSATRSFHTTSSVCSNEQFDAVPDLTDSSCVGDVALDNGVRPFSVAVQHGPDGVCMRTTVFAPCSRSDAVDCVYSAWNNGTCELIDADTPCGCRQRIDNRTVLVEARNGGAGCDTDTLTRFTACGECGVCDDPCANWEWSAWTPCNHHCNQHVVPMDYDPYYRTAFRTRYQRLTKSTNLTAAECGLVNETALCSELPNCVNTFGPDHDEPACTLSSTPIEYIHFAPPCGLTYRTEVYNITLVAPTVAPYGCPSPHKRFYEQMNTCVWHPDDPNEIVKCVDIYNDTRGVHCHEHWRYKFHEPAAAPYRPCMHNTTAASSDYQTNWPGALRRTPQVIGRPNTTAHIVWPIPGPQLGPFMWFMSVLVPQTAAAELGKTVDPLVPPPFLYGSDDVWSLVRTQPRYLSDQLIDQFDSDTARERATPTLGVREEGTYHQSCYHTCLSTAAAAMATEPCAVLYLPWDSSDNPSTLFESEFHTSQSLHRFTGILKPNPATGVLDQVEPMGFWPISSDTGTYAGGVAYCTVNTFGATLEGFGCETELIDGFSYGMDALAPRVGSTHAIFVQMNLTTGFPDTVTPTLCHFTQDASWQGCGYYEFKCLRDADTDILYFQCPWTNEWVLNNTIPLDWPGRYADCTDAETRSFCSPTSYARPFQRMCVRERTRFNEISGHTYTSSPYVRTCESRPCTATEQRNVCNGTYSHGCEAKCVFDVNTQRELCEVDYDFVAPYTTGNVTSCPYPSATRPARFCTHEEQNKRHDFCGWGRFDRGPHLVADPTCRVTCSDVRLSEDCKLEVRCNATEGDELSAWVHVYADTTPPTPASEWYNSTEWNQTEFEAHTRPCTLQQQLDLCGSYAHECRYYNDSGTIKLVDGLCGPPSEVPVRACVGYELWHSCALGFATHPKRPSQFCFATFAEATEAQPHDLFYNKTLWMMCSHTSVVFKAAVPDLPDARNVLVPKQYADFTLGTNESTRDCGEGWLTDPQRAPCRARACRYTHDRGFFDCECNVDTCHCPNRRPIDLRTKTGVRCSAAGSRRVTTTSRGGRDDARTYCGTHAVAARINCTVGSGGYETCELDISLPFAPCTCNASLGVEVVPYGGFACGGTAAECTPPELRSCGEATESCVFAHARWPDEPLRNASLDSLEGPHCRCFSWAVTGESLRDHVDGLDLDDSDASDADTFPAKFSSTRQFAYWNGSMSGKATLESFFASVCVFPLTAFDGADPSAACVAPHDEVQRLCERDNTTSVRDVSDGSYVDVPGQLNPYKRTYVSELDLVRWPLHYNHTTYMVPSPVDACGALATHAVARFFDFKPYNESRVYIPWPEIPTVPQRLTVVPNSCQCPTRDPPTLYAFNEDGTTTCVDVSDTEPTEHPAHYVTIPLEADTPLEAAMLGNYTTGWALNLSSIFSDTQDAVCT